MIRSKKITNSARMEDCTLRIYPYCNFNSETTVFAHINDGSKGMGLKPNDICGVYACSACHDIIDGRTNYKIPKEELYKCIISAMQLTLMRLIEKGVLKVG